MLLATASARDVEYMADQGAGDWTSATWSIDGDAGRVLQGSRDEGHVYSGDRIEIDMQPSQSLSLDGSIRLRKKTSIDLRGGTLEVFGQIGDKLATSSGQLTVSGSAVLRAGELLLNKRNHYFTMRDQSRVELDALFLRGVGDSRIEFAGGTLVLSDSNPIYGASFVEMDADITAAAGQFKIVHLNASMPEKTLAFKVSQDLFSIDGTRILVESDGSNVGSLNQELAGIVVNGKFLQITEEQVAGMLQQTLALVDIPEPAVAGLLLGGLVAGAVVLRRRKR